MLDKNLSKFVKNLTSCYISTEKLIDKFFTNFDKFLSKYSMELDSYTHARVWTSSGSGYPANAVDTGGRKKDVFLVKRGRPMGWKQTFMK